MLKWMKKKKVTEDLWGIAESEEEGYALLFRYRQQPPRDAESRLFPHLLNICWLYDGSLNGGMPPSEILDRMVDFETRLDILEGPGTGYLMLSITGHNRKEWAWYIADKVDFLKRANKVLSGAEVFPVEFEAADDPNWSNYQGFLHTIKH
jgi:hypothetical protein